MTDRVEPDHYVQRGATPHLPHYASPRLIAPYLPNLSAPLHTAPCPTVTNNSCLDGTRQTLPSLYRPCLPHHALPDPSDPDPALHLLDATGPYRACRDLRADRFRVLELAEPLETDR